MQLFSCMYHYERCLYEYFRLQPSKHGKFRREVSQPACSVVFESEKKKKKKCEELREPESEALPSLGKGFDSAQQFNHFPCVQQFVRIN